jgi:hypothetical protein
VRDAALAGGAVAATLPLRAMGSAVARVVSVSGGTGGGSPLDEPFSFC